MSTLSTTVRIKVTPQVVRIVGKEAPRDLQLSAARGALPLAASDLVTVFFFFCNGKDQELKKLSRASLQELPISLLSSVVSDPATNAQLLYFLARERIQEEKLIEKLLQNPSTGNETFLYCARRCSAPVLTMISENSRRMADEPGLIEALLSNPRADKVMKYRLGWVDPDAERATESVQAETPGPDTDSAEAGQPPAEIEEVEAEHQSKYQQSLVLGVSDKIKMAMTGDKEWRSLLLRDPNKLVSSAVLKNPRMTDGEALMIAKTKTASDDMIRIILLNKEWMKNYEIRKALTVNPRTPLNKALRFMGLLTEKDLKSVASSKDASAVIVNSARRIITMKERKKG